MNNQNESALAYFARMQSQKSPDDFYHRPEIWDERAQAWAEQYGDPRNAKSEDRVQANIDYLLERGALTPDSDVVDIGCGPGRFVAGFARRARHVLGIDFSEKMIEQSRIYMQQEGITNASFMVHDFNALDATGKNLAGKFDLVFASNTPAVQELEGLEKAIELSRKYCAIVTQIQSKNLLENRIMGEVFGRRPHPGPSGQWFYAAFNILFLMGYYPQTSYYNRHSECSVSPAPDYAKILMERMLPPDKRTSENEGLICEWLRAHAGPDGSVSEVRNIRYGRILWDVRERTERPAYPCPEYR